LADFGGVGKAKPFREERLWHMGVVLAAQELNSIWPKRRFDLKKGRITLRGPSVNGLSRWMRTATVTLTGACPQPSTTDRRAHSISVVAKPPAFGGKDQ